MGSNDIPLPILIIRKGPAEVPSGRPLGDCLITLLGPATLFFYPKSYRGVYGLVLIDSDWSYRQNRIVKKIHKMTAVF